jgi:CheY-like chemotaxis protein
MSSTQLKLLIVDDEADLRLSLSHLFMQFGHRVRTTEDGFSALQEFRSDPPDILLSDLNMPGMSGFELLSVVRRRYPVTYAIAMSGAFSGESVPHGIAADAFYEKGAGVGLLLSIMEAASEADRPPLRHADVQVPIWIPSNGHDHTGSSYVMICCPECLRAFPEVLGEVARPVYEANCTHCGSQIHYAIAHVLGNLVAKTAQRSSAAGAPAPMSVARTGRSEAESAGSRPRFRGRQAGWR